MAVLAGVLVQAGTFAQAPEGGETLYNGIRLPAEWPPRTIPESRAPMPVPYLDAPPALIPIDVGRQLFVDDFLIEETTLTRTHHAATYWPGNPLLSPDRPWEDKTPSANHPAPTAMVFSDGVWYDAQDGLFKMWYMGGYCDATCYATSKDGITWEKPELDVAPGTNIVQDMPRDSTTVWLDYTAKDPSRRFVMFSYARNEHSGTISVFFSADGIHWSDWAGGSKNLGDRTTAFFNPFRNVWVLGVRDYASGTLGRYRRYWEGADPLHACQWEGERAPMWVGADDLDPRREDLNTPCELYNLDAVAYESLMIGLFDIWRGQPTDRAKPNELCIGYSRDGFHWYRPVREPFIPVSEHYGDWNWGNVQSAGGCCLVVGDQLRFYVSGRRGVQGSNASGVCCTGLATLRRDGFASMDAGASPGQLTTRPVRFSGKHLFVNVDCPDGELRAAVLDEAGNPLPSFTMDECVPVAADATRAHIRWKNAGDLSDLSGKAVRFQFSVRNGRLYAFWVSPEESGASHGYVAAGGPGFTGPVDTVGSTAR